MYTPPPPARGVPWPTWRSCPKYLHFRFLVVIENNQREAAAKVSIPSMAARGVPCPTLVAAAAGAYGNQLSGDS